MTEDLNKKDKEYIWHPFTSLSEGAGNNISIESAKGIYLHTHDGRKIIDAVSSWWVNIHGHSNEYLADALYDQAKKLEHVIFAGFTHKPAVTLAERLIDILPGPQEKIFFSDNGSTAVEVAIKIAFQYWYNIKNPKTKLIAIRGAYHGDTFGAMSVGDRGEFTKPFLPFLFDVEYVDFPEEGKEANSVQQFSSIVKKGNVAAFIYEPLLQGAGGMRTYSVKVLQQMLEIAKEKNVICIADEVMTGFGRTGKLFASEYLNLYPDLICLSKGLTGGTMPLGITACAGKITEAFKNKEQSKTFFHGHSFTANPLACAVANASLDLLLKPQCQAQIQMISENHLKFKNKIKNHPEIKKINCIGTIISIEIITKKESSYFNKIRNYLYEFFIERNILLRPLGNTLYVMPPYIISEGELNQVYESILELLDSITFHKNIR